jgi:hypothetical protein
VSANRGESSPAEKLPKYLKKKIEDDEKIKQKGRLRNRPYSEIV